MKRPVCLIRWRRSTWARKAKGRGSEPRNEGEGNRTAARRYNEAQRRFVQPGQVGEKAREAEKLLEGSEKGEMERTEAIGTRHMTAEDPQITRKH
jgi:hypothetical protein